MVEADVDILRRRTSEGNMPKVENSETDPPLDKEGMKKRLMMAGGAQNRVNEWTAQTLEDPRLLNTLHEGLVMKIRVEKHQFRDRVKSKEKSTAPFMVKK